MIVLTILGWLLLLLVVLVVLLLVVPMHLRLAAVAGPGVSLRFDLRLISDRAPRIFRIETTAGEGAPPSEKKAKRDVASRKSGRRRAGRKRGERAWTRRLIAEAPGAALDTLGAVHVDRLRAWGWFGLADPADTGLLWGRLAPVLYAFSGPFDFDVRPRFDKVGLGGEAEARLHFTILRLIVPGARLFFRVAPWRG